VTERILVVDDEPEIRRALRAALRPHGYEVEVVSTGNEALRAAAERRPDLVILDLRLPDMDGREVCLRLRAWSRVPVIVLSVADDERTKIAALDTGADDYLVKPFSAGELLARIRAARRRAQEDVLLPVIQLGELRIDRVARTVALAGRPVRLTPKEYDLLTYLAANPGRVLTHRMILGHVWGPEYGDEVQYLRVFVRSLRRKIEPDPEHPRYILTDIGVGYHFPAPEADQPPGSPGAR
jgi:two-component system KDP operon response regulator KdpE